MLLGNRRIFDMWLACYTQQEIADAVGCHPTDKVLRVSGNLEDLPKNQQSAATHATDFDPPLYNIWKQQKKSEGSSHFGNSEVRWVWREALMALALDNEHGEWTPLHYGLHALACVELSKGGAGRKGGLREYARRIGRDHQHVSQWIHAAQVAKTGTMLCQLFDKTYHLAAIHAAAEVATRIWCGGFRKWTKDVNGAGIAGVRKHNQIRNIA